MQKKVAAIILVIFGLTIYFNSLFNQFLWDDEEAFISNAAILNVKNIPKFFIGTETDANGIIAHSGQFYRPVMAVFYALIYSISGGRPFLFRVFQVGVHLANAFLVFLIFEYFFKKSKYIPFFLSLLFLIHPAVSEAVLFTSATQEVLFFFFGIIGFYLLLNLKNQDLPNFILINIFLLISLLTKETGIVFFTLLFVYIFLFENKEIIRFGVIEIVFIYLYFFARSSLPVSSSQAKQIYPIMNSSIWVRFLTIPKIILYYLEKFFFPLRLAISQQWVVSKLDVRQFFIPLILDVIFFATMTVYVIVKKNKVFIFFLAWFVIGLLPHLQIIPLNMTAAERWLYFSSVGLLGMLGVLFSSLEKKYSDVFTIFFCVIIFLLSARTLSRTFDWKNGLTLFSHDIELSKDNFELESNLGAELYRAKKTDDAKKHFEKSIQLAPNWWINWNNLGAVYASKKDYKKAEYYYKKSMEKADYYLAYINYIEILIKQSKFLQAKDFIEKDAFKKFPSNKGINNLYKFLLTKIK